MKKNRGSSHPFAKFIFFLFLAALLMCLAYWAVCLSRPGKGRLCPKAETALRVATININAFRYLKTPEDAARYLISVFEGNDVDVMLIQEYFQSKWFSDTEFKDLLSDEYKYVITAGEQAIISKHPVLEHDLTVFDSSSNSFLSTVIDFDGEPVTVISVHLQTTGFNAVAGEENNRLMVGYVLKANEEARLYQAMQLRSVIDRSEYPVIVAGDFNSVPYSKVYRTVKQKTLKDTYMEKGRGKGATYRNLYDMLKIDYIFHDDSFVCTDCMICEDFISDHRMLISTLNRI